MNRRGCSGLAVVLVAALVWATMPAAPARAEAGADSVGAAVTIGLMVAVVVVYGFVALRSDVDRYTEADVERAIRHAAQVANESPVVLQALTEPAGCAVPGAGSRTEVAGAAVGWRLTF